MDQVEFSTAEREGVPYGRFHHPPPRGQRKMEVLYLKRQGGAAAEVGRLGAIARPPYARYLREYRSGGLENLKEVPVSRRSSEVAASHGLLAADFRQHPPASVAHAAQRIEQWTGLKRRPTQGRECLKSLGMKPRKVGQLPAKADGEAQEACKTAALEPRLQEAQAGQRLVFFLDAAHFVFAPFLGVVWCFARLLAFR